MLSYESVVREGDSGVLEVPISAFICVYLRLIELKEIIAVRK
jgi:hypothetical protein